MAGHFRFEREFDRLRRFERHASTASECRAVGLLAACAVVDAPTVTAIEAGFRAELPNRVLDEPREVARISRVEAARVDPAGDLMIAAQPAGA